MIKRSAKYLCLATFLVLVPFCANSQSILERKISLPDTSCELYQALLLIEDLTDHRFSYNADLIASDSIVELNSEPRPLREVLEQIISDSLISYRVIGNQIVFYKPDYSLTENDTATLRYIFLRGRVIDKSSSAPVAYANVGLPGTNKGTVTNNQGEFLLKVQPSALNDTVSITFLGYMTAVVPVLDLYRGDQTIVMQREFIPIQEVIIRRTEPLMLLGSAIDRFSDNYPREATLLTAFYRETILKNSRYIEVSEAILNIYKPSYSLSFDTEQIKILKGRRNSDLEITDTISLKLKAGLNTILILDVIRNRPEFLRKETLHYFKYRMSDIILYDDKYTYAIDFTQKEYAEPPHYQGRIYVDMETLAVVAVEFELMPEEIDRAARYLVLRKPRGYIVRPLSASYMVKYSQKNRRYYLSMIRTENKFRIRRKGRLFGNNFNVVSELATTRTDTVDVRRFRRRETVYPEDAFNELLGGFDQEFWGEYNYIIPEEPLEEALKRISNLMEQDD